MTDRRVNYVNISGGKDSTATLLLAIERDVENLRAVFADTGHEHQQTYDYLDYLEKAVNIPIRRVKANFKIQIANKREYIVRKWADDGVSDDRINRALELLVPTGNPFLDMCLWKGRFPSTKARFCTEELKVLPMMRRVFIPATQEFDEVWSWQGVRRDESRFRANLDETEQGDFGIINYRPILDWTAEDCFAMHKKHGIDWNPLYEQGMGRVGCMPCVNCRKLELREISNRFPDEVQRVAKWEQLVSEVSRRGSSTFFPAVVHSGRGNKDVDYIRNGIDAAVQWSKTSHGGKQYDLMADEEPQLCSSLYGLCE